MVSNSANITIDATNIPINFGNIPININISVVINTGDITLITEIASKSFRGSNTNLNKKSEVFSDFLQHVGKSMTEKISQNCRAGHLRYFFRIENTYFFQLFL